MDPTSGKRNKYHPKNVAIDNIIKAINKFQNEDHEIILTMDINESFTHSTGCITRLYLECKLHAPLFRTHSQIFDSKYHIRRSYRIE